MYTIFLSSTFNDMQNERDAFHRVILPHVNGTLAEYGQSAQLCDLRWGVDTSGDGEAESTRTSPAAICPSCKRCSRIFLRRCTAPSRA